MNFLDKRKEKEMLKKIKEFFRERKIEKSLFNFPAFSERYANGEKMPNEEGVCLGTIKRKNKPDFEIVDKSRNIPIAFIGSTKNLDVNKEWENFVNSIKPLERKKKWLFFLRGRYEKEKNIKN